MKTIIFALLPFLVFFNNNQNTLTGINQSLPQENAGILEKMIVANGNIAMDIDVSRLSRNSSEKRPSQSRLRYDIENNAFFTVLVYNNELRGPLPSSMSLISRNSADLPSKLRASNGQLAIESLGWGGQYDLVVRDAKSGFIFFNVEGYEFDYNPTLKRLDILNGRLLISDEFAAELGDESKVGTIVGELSMTANMTAIEVNTIINGEVTDSVLPAGTGLENKAGSVPGPDVVVGDVNGLAQFGGASGTRVGLSLGTDSCNFGTVDLNWLQMPNNDHPTIPQNLYRMSGGTSNTERFEQIGQSRAKHGFTALTNNICGLGCNGVGGPQLGSGCSDPYSASLNSGTLSSRAWINPFTGAFPRGDSATPPGFSTSVNNRILTEIANLNTTTNPGATYFAEGQYVTPHEYAWCQANPGQCNMNNNVSYRRYTVTGTGSPFSFSPAAATVRQKAAITAWTGATVVDIRPDPVNDGIGAVAYKVTNPSAGVWHYEYAIYNQNMDRGIQSFSIPTGSGITLTNVGFSAPPQHPGAAGDGTFNNLGYSSTPWAQTQNGTSMTWNSETLAQNPNANAIRWGTMYSFRFDSNRPPQTTNATLGFFKTGSPISVQVQGPSPLVAASVSVSGRVSNSAGRGVNNARVILTDSSNNVRRVITSPFGYYRFTEVPTGTYNVAVTSKSYTFTPRVLQVNDNLTNEDFVALP